MLRIDALLVQIAERANHSGTVLLIGDAEPFRIGLQHLDAGLSAPDKLVNHTRNVALSLGLVQILLKEFLENTLNMFKKRRVEALKIHGNQCVRI